MSSQSEKMSIVSCITRSPRKFPLIHSGDNRDFSIGHPLYTVENSCIKITALNLSFKHYQLYSFLEISCVLWITEQQYLELHRLKQNTTYTTYSTGHITSDLAHFPKYLHTASTNFQVQYAIRTALQYRFQNWCWN